MRLPIIYLFVLFHFLSVKAQTTIQRDELSFREHTEAEILEDIRVLRDILDEAHPSFYLYNTRGEIDRAFDELIQNVATRHTEREFYKEFLGLISKINCGHTWLNASGNLSDSLWQNNANFPLEVKIIEDKLISAGNDINAPINKGNEILKINGLPANHLIQTFLKYTVGDGFIRTGRIRIVERRFGFYFALLYGFPSEYQVTFVDDLQQVSQVSLPPGLNTPANSDSSKVDNGNLQFRAIDSAVGVLRIKSFSDWRTENKKIDFKAALKEVFRELNELKYENLIIDLRDNRGGSDAYGLALLSHLVSDSIRPFRNMYSKTIDSPLLRTYSNLEEEVYQGLPEITTRLKDSTYVYCQQIWMSLLESGTPESALTNSCNEPFAPAEPNYNGNLYLLINGNTFSTATDVSSILFSRGLATFYGEETGGGYYGNTSGITTTVTLPNTGFKLRLPLIRYETNVGEIFPIGSGVVPHYPISETVKSLRSEEDELLNYVIKTIKR